MIPLNRVPKKNQCLLEQRQSKNDAIWSKSKLILKLPPFFTARIGEWKSAANSKLICHSTKWSRSYIVLTLALLKDRFRLRNDLPILVSHFYPLRDERKGLYLFNILELLRHNFAIMEKLQDQSSVTYHACACKIVFFGQMYCIVPVTSKICQICSRWRHIKTPQKYQNQIKEALTILPYREVDRGQRFDYSYETRPIKTNIIKCT